MRTVLGARSFETAVPKLPPTVPPTPVQAFEPLVCASNNLALRPDVFSPDEPWPDAVPEDPFPSSRPTAFDDDSPAARVTTPNNAATISMRRGSRFRDSRISLFSPGGQCVKTVTCEKP